MTVTTLLGELEVFVGEISNSDAGAVCCLKNDQITYLIFTLTDTGGFALDIYEKGTVLYGSLVSESKGASVDITINSDEFGAINAGYKISELKEVPKSATEEYIDILDMDFSDLQRLLYDFGICYN